MSRSKELWEEASLLRVALNHRFLRGLRESILPSATLREHDPRETFFEASFRVEEKRG